VKELGLLLIFLWWHRSRYETWLANTVLRNTQPVDNFTMTGALPTFKTILCKISQLPFAYHQSHTFSLVNMTGHLLYTYGTGSIQSMRLFGTYYHCLHNETKRDVLACLKMANVPFCLFLTLPSHKVWLSSAWLFLYIFADSSQQCSMNVAVSIESPFLFW